jgi:hypothetical protein
MKAAKEKCQITYLRLLSRNPKRQKSINDVFQTLRINAFQP